MQEPVVAAVERLETRLHRCRLFLDREHAVSSRPELRGAPAMPGFLTSFETPSSASRWPAHALKGQSGGPARA